MAQRDHISNYGDDCINNFKILSCMFLGKEDAKQSPEFFSGMRNTTYQSEKLFWFITCNANGSYSDDLKGDTKAGPSIHQPSLR
jgi:hypothetical protein